MNSHCRRKKISNVQKENHQQHDFLKISNFHLNEVTKQNKKKKTAAADTLTKRRKEITTATTHTHSASLKQNARTHYDKLRLLIMCFDISVHFHLWRAPWRFSHHFSLSMALIIAHDHFCGNTIKTTSNQCFCWTQQRIHSHDKRNMPKIITFERNERNRFIVLGLANNLYLETLRLQLWISLPFQKCSNRTSKNVICRRIRVAAAAVAVA